MQPVSLHDAAPPLTGRGLADLHVHTSYSDGRDSPATILEHLRRYPCVDVVAITDHDTIAGAMEAWDIAARFPDSPSIIVGEEVTTTHGHVLGLFLERPVRPHQSAEATVDAIHEQGGVAVAAHPFWRTTGSRRRPAHGLGALVAELDFDGIETVNGSPNPYILIANRRARILNLQLQLARVGGSDAHIKELVGSAGTAFAGSSAAALKLAVGLRTAEPQRLAPLPLSAASYLRWGLSGNDLTVASADVV